MEYRIPDIEIRLSPKQWVDITENDAIWYIGEGKEQIVIMSKAKALKIETKLGGPLENT